jgi:molecular chaperone DnaK
VAFSVGIDLGTSNSVVAVVQADRTTVIPDAEGNRIHPSVVSFGPDGRVLVGHAARRQLVYAPERTVLSAKRLIGRSIFSQEVAWAMKNLPYELVAGPSNDVRIVVGATKYTLQEISAYILRHLKEIAEQHLLAPVDKAVITVPAYFNDAQRQATRDAGEIAGLEVLRIINEPTAAALAYGLGKGLDQHVAVYDLGGGTFDISILHIMDDVFEVVSTSGDTFLGGDDFDQALYDHFLGLFPPEQQVLIQDSPAGRQRLKNIARDIKHRLTFENETSMELSGLVAGADEVSHDITREQYDSLVFPLVQRTFQVCDEAMSESSLKVGTIDRAVLVGGMTRAPVIREAVAAYFQAEPAADINPDEVVAVGAAIQAHALSATTDEEVAAAPLLIDVTPQSLGIGTVAGYVERLIDRNSPVPTGRSKVFTTSIDFQREVCVRVCQGESRRVEQNAILGEFALEGLRPAPRGEVRVEVSFEIDADGIVQVTARDLETGAEQFIRVSQATGTLAPEELEAMKARQEGAP